MNYLRLAFKVCILLPPVALATTTTKRHDGIGLTSADPLICEQIPGINFEVSIISSSTENTTVCSTSDSSYELEKYFLFTKHPELADVSLSLLPSENGDGTFKTFPLVVEPHTAEQKSISFLSEFVEANREWIDDMMLQYGAVLFRGFDIVVAQDVEDVVLAKEPQKLSSTYRGTSPRHAQGNSTYIFSAAEVPTHWPIAQHCEMSFLESPPPQLFFSALTASKTIGGETALADMRKVYEDIPPALRHKLQTKKLRYTRTHKKVAEKYTHDVAAMLSWPEMFRTSSKAEVEELAAAEGMNMHWEGDTFVSEFTSEAFQMHPQTQEKVWYNHAQVFHWTTFPAELFHAFRRTHDVRYLMRSVAIGAYSWVKYGLLGRKMALHVSFGDGEPISIWEMHQIRKAVHKNSVYNRWEQGDLVMIDNFSTSHGRQPTYDHGRNIVVSWMEPILKGDAMKDYHLTEDYQP